MKSKALQEQMMLLSDADFSQQFADCTLDPKLFTHSAHLRLAWISIRQNGITKAIALIREQIKAYDQKFGDGTKYHETLTVAALHVVHHFMKRSYADSFDGFISEFPRLKTHFKDLIAQHYSIDLFQDADAKEKYVQPDLQDFG